MFENSYFIGHALALIIGRFIEEDASEDVVMNRDDLAEEWWSPLFHNAFLVWIFVLRCESHLINVRYLYVEVELLTVANGNINLVLLLFYDSRLAKVDFLILAANFLPVYDNASTQAYFESFTVFFAF